MPTKLEDNLRWQDQKAVKTADGNWVLEGRPPAQLFPAFHESPSNIPNHYYLGVRVNYPPGAGTPPHKHGGAAVVATVLRGKVVNQMICPGEDQDGQGKGPHVYGPGETWYEPPGCHHVRATNASETEEAEFIACFVVEKKTVDEGGLRALVVIDAAERERLEGEGKL